LETSVPIHCNGIGKLKKNRITQGIKISCKHKEFVYSKSSNNPDPRACYIKRCKILNIVIKEAKNSITIK
jgi:hypothetical protein